MGILIIDFWKVYILIFKMYLKVLVVIKEMDLFIKLRLLNLWVYCLKDLFDI